MYSRPDSTSRQTPPSMPWFVRNFGHSSRSMPWRSTSRSMSTGIGTSWPKLSARNLLASASSSRTEYVGNLSGSTSFPLTPLDLRNQPGDFVVAQLAVPDRPQEGRHELPPGQVADVGRQ